MIPHQLPSSIRLACEALADFNWTKNRIKSLSLTSEISRYTHGEDQIQNSSLSMGKQNHGSV